MDTQELKKQIDKLIIDFYTGFLSQEELVESIDSLMRKQYLNGYNTGFANGHDEGYEFGYSFGYANGLDDGWDSGYARCRWDANED